MNSSDSVSTIVESERLVLREIGESDASFINILLNTDSFTRFIGDRGVRSDEDAGRFIKERYRQSYADHGYGLYVVLLKTDSTPIGMCGFVRRGSLPGPDIGFALLPEHEHKGYGFESAAAVMNYGREVLGFNKVFAITSIDNTASEKLLLKLGFVFDSLTSMPDGEELKLFRFDEG